MNLDSVKKVRYMDMMPCPHCQSMTYIDTKCTYCNEILPLLKSNPFIILNLKPTLDLSKDSINTALINKLSLYHPDKFIHASTLARKIIMNNSSMLNDAAQNLKNLDSRITSLLSFYHFNLDEFVNKQVNEMHNSEMHEFFTIQEDIEQLNSLEDMNELLSIVDIKLINIYNQLIDSFDKQNFINAYYLSTKRKFFMRIKLNIEEKIENLYEVI